MVPPGAVLAVPNRLALIDLPYPYSVTVLSSSLDPARPLDRGKTYRIIDKAIRGKGVAKFFCSAFSAHAPEKWEPVFRKGACANARIYRAAAAALPPSLCTASSARTS